MKAVLWFSVVVLIAIGVDSKAVDKKKINDKRSIEIAPNSFLNTGIELINPGTTGLISTNSLPVGLISPAISYDSGSALFSGYLGASSLGYNSFGGYDGGFGSFGGALGDFGSTTISPLNVGEAFGGSIGNAGLVASTGSVASLGEGVSKSSSEVGSSSLAAGGGAVSTTVSPLPASSVTNVGGTRTAAPISVINQDTHEYRHLTQQVPVSVPQPVPFTITRTIPVPQPYKVHVPKPYPVPVEVKVPVEVPKPYTVRVPQPVSVPVAVRVPIEIPRPYPVYKTKEVKVEIEKPVFIRVPVKIQVPVPQAYRVDVPTPVAYKVPQPVFVKESRVLNTYSNGGTFGGEHGGLYGLGNIYGLGGTLGDFGSVNTGNGGINTIGGVTQAPTLGGVFGDLGGNIIGGFSDINSGFGVTESTLQGSTPLPGGSVNVEDDSVTVEGRSGESNTVVSVGGGSDVSATESNSLDNEPVPTEASVGVTTLETPTTPSDVEISSPSLLD